MSTIIYSLLIWCFQIFKSAQAWLYRKNRSTLEGIINRRLRRAGITVNGKNPWDPVVTDKEFYTSLACYSTLGCGEAYMDGMWECEALDENIYRVFHSGLYFKYLHRTNRFINYLNSKGFNLQTKAKAFEVGEKHYDLGNDLFESFLDPYMNYSCGYWKTADNLNQAQLDKMELIAQKLMLKPGMRVLDIGCGWGGLCKYLAEKYKVQMVGITISQEGAKYAQNVCTDLPVDIRVQDYRDLDEKFDRIVSVGMFEHVGPANYREFFEVTHKCLEEDGVFLLHTIGVNHSDGLRTDPWVHKYIFPNGILPHHAEILNTTDGLYVMEDWQNMSNDYNRTLMAWYANFIKAWPKLSTTRSQRFFRMWKYYLLSAAGVFRARDFQLWQVVLSKNGIPGGYYAPR